MIQNDEEKDVPSSKKQWTKFAFAFKTINRQVVGRPRKEVDQEDLLSIMVNIS